jgi:hypothetical protein
MEPGTSAPEARHRTPASKTVRRLATPREALASAQPVRRLRRAAPAPRQQTIVAQAAPVAKPRAVKAQPRVIASRPRVIASQPEVVASRPRIVASQPRVVASRPSVAGSQPRVIASQPRVAASRPSAVTSRPAAVASRNLSQRLLIARAKAAEAAAQARKVSEHLASQPRALASAKPAAGPELIAAVPDPAAQPKAVVAQRAKPAVAKRNVASAPVTVRRSLYGVATDRELLGLPARTTVADGSPSRAKSGAQTKRVSSSAGSTTTKSTPTAQAQTPKRSGLAWYEMPKQATPKDDSPIRPVSLTEAAPVPDEPASADGRKLSVRAEKRGLLRGAEDRRSRIAHYLLQLGK